MTRDARSGSAWERALLAAAFAVPSLLHALGHGPLAGGGAEQVVLVALAFALPWAFAIGGAPARAERVLAATVAAAFTVPLVPVVLHALPFEIERAVLHGGLAALAASGALGRAARALARARGRAGLAALVLALWAAGSAGSAVLGYAAALPDGLPAANGFLPALHEVLWRDLLVPRSPLDPSAAPRALLLRLETLAIAAAALGLALERGDRGRALLAATLRAASVALIAGVAVAYAEMVRAALWRGESVAARLAAPLGRMHRPLLDNNALGSALVAWWPLVLALPVAGVAARCFARRRARAADASERPALEVSARWALLGSLAALAGAFLLLASRSKAALGGAALALVAWAIAAFGARRLVRARIVAVPAVLGVVVLVVVQLLPAAAIGRIASTSRYAEDALRTLRADAAVRYLVQNRSGPWSGAVELTVRSPLVGHGLGSHPRVLARVHDAERRIAFNPRHENAHNQVLQWAAEEGVTGALLGLSLFALALAGAWRSAALERGPRRWPEPAALARAAVAGALVGLAVNVQLGHPLLELGAAYPLALVGGLGLAGLAGRAEPASAPRRRRVVVLAAALLAFASSVLGLVRAERPRLGQVTLGTFPWVERPAGTPPRDRLLADDARWFQRWGDGSRMLLPLRDVRPAGIGAPQRIDVWIAGRRVVTGELLPAAPSKTDGADAVTLKVDGPPDVRAGDFVEVRVVTRPPFAETLQFGTGRARVGVRAGQAAFVDPR